MNRLDAIRQRIARATEGPWTTDPDVLNQHVYAGADLVADAAILFPLGSRAQRTDEECSANGDFIAHSRADLPDLLAVVEAVVELRLAKAAAFERDEFDSSEVFSAEQKLADIIFPLLQEMKG